MWYVYFLQLRNGDIYVGSTNDLKRRTSEHFAARGGHYTSSNPPARLVYTESFATRAGAEKRERQLNRWTRRKKEALIAGDLDLLKRL